MNTEICIQLGSRIKARRKELNLTQSAVCGSKITRNMLSCIENGTACPSVDTLIYLSERLNMPVEYFLSKDSHNASLYKRIESINDIRKLFSSGQYKKCLSICETTQLDDAEIIMIMAECKLRLAFESMNQCMLNTALKLLDECENIANNGIYSIDRFSSTVSFYRYLIESIKTNECPYIANYNNGDSILADNEFIMFVYTLELLNKGLKLVSTSLPNFSNKAFYKYILAISYIDESQYENAIANLIDIFDLSPNFFVRYHTTERLEYCYKEIGDYKNAYEYAKMRLDLLDKFND